MRATGKPVFVSPTAAWCIACLANERIALGALRGQVLGLIRPPGVVSPFMRRVRMPMRAASVPAGASELPDADTRLPDFGPCHLGLPEGRLDRWVQWHKKGEHHEAANTQYRGEAR